MCSEDRGNAAGSTHTDWHYDRCVMRLPKWRSHWDTFLIRWVHSNALSCRTGMVCRTMRIFSLVEWILGSCGAIQFISDSDPSSLNSKSFGVSSPMSEGSMTSIQKGARERGYYKNEAKSSSAILTLHVHMSGTMESWSVWQFNKLTIHSLDWPLQYRNPMHKKQVGMDGKFSGPRSYSCEHGSKWKRSKFY